MTWHFDWITDWDEIWSEPFLARWREWMRVSPTAHVFFHPTLVRVWVDTYMPLRRMEPRFLVATNEGCTAFLPMVLWRRNWKNAFQRLLIPVGYSDYDYHDPIISGKVSDCDWDQFWDAYCHELAQYDLRREYDVVELPGIREMYISQDGSWSSEESCPFIDLSSYKNLQDFLAMLSTKHRYNLRRRRRLLESEGAVTFKVLGPADIAESQRDLREMLAHHSRRWPNAYKAPNFHTNLIQDGVAEGLVHFSKLCLNGKAISWRMGFTYRDRRYSYMPAYDIEYERFSPGQLHLLLCIGEAIGRRLTVFDQLRGEETYKAGWTNQVERLCTLRIAGDSLGSRLRNIATDQVKPALARVAYRQRRRSIHD
jgi:CelD/BcsL family acetyltransferase involved in cellulose biosynthesis